MNDFYIFFLCFEKKKHFISVFFKKKKNRNNFFFLISIFVFSTQIIQTEFTVFVRRRSERWARQRPRTPRRRRRAKNRCGERARGNYQGEKHQHDWTGPLRNRHVVLFALSGGVCQVRQTLLVRVLPKVHEEGQDAQSAQGQVRSQSKSIYFVFF